jgi:DNA-binding transcriptional LysR family regulator
MEFRQLTYFLAAAQTQNFRKAAEICYVAQSALSRQIAALEEELGVELFRRVDRRVVLTGAGQEFAVYARNALDELQKGQQAAHELAAGQRGTILLGCIEALAVTFLPPIFAEFHARFPHVRLKVRVGGADDLMRQIEGGELDFGLIFDPTLHSELLVIHELFRQPVLCAIAPQHPLAQELDQPLTFAQVIEHPLIVLGEGFSMRRITQAIFQKHGQQLQPLVEIDSVEGMKELVKKGIGICLTPAALLRPEQIGRELIVRPVADLPEQYGFALVYRRIGSTSAVARGLIEAIKSVIGG